MARLKKNGLPRSFHGKSGTRVYSIWCHMHDRCYNPDYINYNNYGGRGITVCKEWSSFEKFYEDMGDPPSERHSLDREDSNKGYSKSNCRWATPSEQALNRCTTTAITFQGQTRPMSEWAVLLGISFKALRMRFHRGWSVGDALTKPLRKSSNAKST